MDVVTCIPRFGADYRIDAFVNQIKDTVSGLIDELAPIQTRKVVNKRHATPWLSRKRSQPKETDVNWNGDVRKQSLNRTSSSTKKHVAEHQLTTEILLGKHRDCRQPTAQVDIYQESAPSHIPSNDTGVLFLAFFMKKIADIKTEILRRPGGIPAEMRYGKKLSHMPLSDRSWTIATAC